MPLQIAASNAFLRYAKAVVLTPTIGSLLLCLIALLPTSVFLLRHVHATAESRPTLATHATTPRPALPAFNTQPHPAPALKHAAYTAPTAKPAKLRPAFFNETVSTDDLRFLSTLVGTPTSTAVRRQDVRALLNKVVPYAPFHYGIDRPLPGTLAGILSESTAPITLRDGRYLVLATLTNHNNLAAQGRRRALLWIDTVTGASIGAIFFYPGNGEPTPTLSLFSRQVEQGSLTFRQLPPAFAADYAAWVDASSMPILATRYFINARGDKTVLTHDDANLCAVLPASQTCADRRHQAEDIDLQASYYIGQVHYASNATLRNADQRE